MTEWGVVVVLITLGTFGIAVVRPIITLTSTITTLTAVVEQLRADVKEQEEGGYLAYVPDLQINSHGSDLANAIYMARDAIGSVALAIEDDKAAFPEPSKSVPHAENEIVSFVDIDLSAYRRSVEKATVRRNVSLPAWLNNAAEDAGLNVSAVLQSALKTQLGIQ